MTAAIRVAGVVMCAAVAAVGAAAMNAPESPVDYSCYTTPGSGSQAPDFCCRGSVHRVTMDPRRWHRM